MGPNAPDQASSARPASPLAKAEPPRGNLAIKTDEKGRLKLPPRYIEYIQALGDSDVFITTTDRETMHVYPMSKWREVEAWFQSPEIDPEFAERMWDVTSHWGGESGIDDQGRILIPAPLRQLIGLVKADVYLCPQRSGRFDVLTVPLYQTRIAQAEAHSRNDVQLAKKLRMP